MAKQLLMSSAYWVLNKTAVRMLGIETAFLLSNMVEAESMMADEEGWFYQTSDTVREMTTLSRHKQDQCIEQLEKLGIIEKDVRGVPPKRYFKINYECLTNQFVKIQQIKSQKTDKLICKKSATNKERIIKNIDKENIYSASSDAQSSSSDENTKAKENAKDKDILVNESFESLWNLYPNKKGKGQVSLAKKKEIYKLGEGEFERCISRYIKYVEQERKKGFVELKYQNGSTFFNSGYVDYLDCNYENKEKKVAEKKEQFKPNFIYRNNI